MKRLFNVTVSIPMVVYAADGADAIRTARNLCDYAARTDPKEGFTISLGSEIQRNEDVLKPWDAYCLPYDTDEIQDDIYTILVKRG